MKKPLLFVIASFILLNATSQQLTAVSINLFTYLPENNNERALEDGVAVFFNNQSDTVDLFDIKKAVNPLENIAILRNNILLAGEQRTTFDTIPLTLWNLKQRDYEVEILLRNITEAYLEDVQTNTKKYFVLADTLRYRFTNTSANSPKDSSIRFRLIFGKPPVPVVNVPQDKDEKDWDVHQPGHHHHGGGIRLYPNPVRGNCVNLEMKNLPSGKYKVTIVSAQYRSYSTILHSKDAVERINTSKLFRGRYYIIIQDEKGWREVKQIEVD